MSYLEGRSPVSPLSSLFLLETTSPDRASRTGPRSPRNGAALARRSACSPRRSARNRQTQVRAGYRAGFIRRHTCTPFSRLSASLTHLGQAGLAVHDEIPVLRVQAVRHFVLPDERPVIRGRPARRVSPARSLGDHSTHRLRHTQVHLQRLRLDKCLRCTVHVMQNNTWRCLIAAVLLLPLTGGLTICGSHNLKVLFAAHINTTLPS